MSSRRRAGIAAASLAGHLLVIAALALSIRPERPPRDTAPPIVVSLVPWMTQRPDRARSRAKAPTKPSQARGKPPPQTARTPPSAPLPPLSLPPNDTRLADQAAVRSALGALVGCAHPDAFKLDAAERERCGRINREMGRDAPTYVVDPHPHGRHDPPVASHGMAVVIGPPPPRPGVLSSLPVGCSQSNCVTPQTGPPP
jgi:hypothetical protein